MAAPATTAINTLTDTQDKVIDTLHRVQAPVVTYVRKAVDRVEASLPDLPTRDFGEKLPSIKQVVDNQFVFAGRMLDNQHRFVADLLEATKPVTEKVVDQKPLPGVRKATKTAKPTTAPKAAAEKPAA
jgi:hypothetical protein